MPRRWGTILTTRARQAALLAALAWALLLTGGAATEGTTPVAPVPVAADPVAATGRWQHVAAPGYPAGAPPELSLVPGTAGSTTWLPSVIFNDGMDAATFEIPITGGTFDAVFLTTEGVLAKDGSFPSGLTLLEPDGELLRLYDDGTNGDRLAGDRTYSRSGILATRSLTHDGGSHQRLDTKLFFFRRNEDQSVQSASQSLDANLGVVDAAAKGTIPVTAISDTLTATSHALFLVDDGTVFPNYPDVDAETAVRVCEGCRILIEQFGDVFDFIVLQTREKVNEPQRSIRQAFFSDTKNDVEGIGLEIRDLNVGANTFVSGEPFNTYSSGTLQGIVFDNTIDGSPLAHELMHRWVAHAGPELGWLDGEGHFISNSTVNGLMDLDLLGGDGRLITREDTPFKPVDLVRNADGTFRLVSRPGEFNATFDPVELYLAGFLPANQVPTMYLLFGSIDLGNEDRVTATDVQEVTITDLIASAGARVPAHAASQRDFRVGAIVVGDRPYTEAEYAFITLALRYFESDDAYDGAGSPPWQAATLGQSTVTLALPGIPADPSEIPGTGAESGDVRSVTLADGWNLVGWTGAASAPSSALASADPIDVLFAWDALAQAFQSFNPTLPPALSTLRELPFGAGLWLRASAGGGAWEQPVFSGAREIVVHEGFNLVMWTGPDGTAVADAVASLGDALVVLFTWNAGAQRFLSYNPALPAALSTAKTLTHGDGIWLQVSRDTVWSQPASGEAGVAAGR